MKRGYMGCVWAMLKPVLMLAASGAVIGIVVIPWAIPIPGRGRLTGGWVGELRSSSGPRAWLYLHLDVSPEYDSPRLGDKATVCTRRRRIHLQVDGYTTAWSGKTVELLLKPPEPSPPELRFDMQGAWNGNALELRQPDRSLAETLNEPNETQTAEPLGSTPWIAASLRRGTSPDFDAACARLARR